MRRRAWILKFSFRTEHTSVVMSYLVCPSLQKQTFSLVCVFFPIQTAWCSRGGFRGRPKGPRPPSPHPFVVYQIFQHYIFNLESSRLLNLSVQNFNLKNFLGGACARNSLEKCAVRSPILPLYTISVGPLYHKILRPPMFNPGLSQFLSAVFVALEHATRVYKILLSQLLLETVMITQNVSLSNT